MSRYETIINLGEDFLKLMGQGIISVHLLDWKVYYEAYLEHLKYLNKHQAASVVATHFDISLRQMMRVVAYMKGA